MFHQTDVEQEHDLLILSATSLIVEGTLFHSVCLIHKLSYKDVNTYGTRSRCSENIFSPPLTTGTKRAGDVWSKSVLLILENLEPS